LEHTIEIEKIYKGWEREISEEIEEIDLMLETFGEIYLKNLNKRNIVGKHAKEIISYLIAKKGNCRNEIKRLSKPNQADSGLVRWHKN